MRNIKIYSGLGSMIEIGTVRLEPGNPMIIQEDQITPQAMEQYGPYLATASMDNVIEHVGHAVNIAFLRRSYGWVEAEEARQRDIKEKDKDEDTGGEDKVPEPTEPPADDEGAEAPSEDSTSGTEEPPKEEEPSTEGSPSEEPPVAPEPEASPEPVPEPEPAPKVDPEYDPFEEDKPEATPEEEKGRQEEKEVVGG